jgi:ABC-type transport system substrate-binding protein
LSGSAPYVSYASIGKLQSAAKAAEVRASGGTIQVALTGELHHLDPSLASTVEDGEILPSIYETLTYDVGGARIVPWLATHYAAEQGGKSYRFRLRDDVRFHDGRRLTPRDVRYSFERLLTNPESTGRHFYSAIRGAKALINGERSDLAGFRIHSSDEFTIELDEPIATFPALISYHAAAIVPEGSDKIGPSWQEGSVGTGPFRVAKFEPGVRVELERNKDYWRRGFPRVEQLVFHLGASPTDILTQFRDGRLSLASDLLPADAEALRRDPEFASRYHEVPRLMTYYAVFNTHQGPLKDKALRQRLAQSIDVETIVRQTLGRLAIPARGLIPPGLLGHDAGYVSRTYVSASSAVREEPESIELTAVLNPVFFGEYSIFAREAANALRDNNVVIKTVNKTMDEWVDATTRGTVDFVLGRWGADFPDADSFANILDSKEGLLGRLCGSHEVDRLIARGRSETSPAVRHAIYREIEDTIVRECLLVPLFHEQTYRFVRPEVEGLSLSYGNMAVNYASLKVRG